MSSPAATDSGPRRAILVLGMHRAGTSAVTRTLALCGASLPRRLIPPNSANRTGFWESERLALLHDDILDAAGRSWDDPRALPKDWLESPAARAFDARLAGLVGEEFGEARLLLVKDPRVCRLVPLWRRVLGAMDIAPLAVLPVRHPLETAASLAARDGMDRDAALGLWLRHVLEAERYSRGWPRSFVAYADFLGDWRGAMARIGSDLDMVWPDLGSGGEEVDAFLSKDLRRNAVAETKTCGLASADAAFRLVLEASRGGGLDAVALDNLDVPKGAAPGSSLGRLVRRGKRSIRRVLSR